MTTPLPQTTQPWKWDYNPEADEWLLTTPEYDPMVSFRATRLIDDHRILFARYQGSTMPREVAEVLVGVVYSSHMFDLADKGAREIILPPDEVLKNAQHIRRLWQTFPMGQAPASYFMRQGE